MNNHVLSELAIERVGVADQLSEISDLMEALHDNERQLFPKTAAWSDIGEAYMRHILEMETDNDGICYAAWWRDTIIGLIFGYTEQEDDSRCEEYVGTIAYISDGYVRPEWRGIGVYKKLNQHIESHFIAKDIKRLTRYTLANNEAMKNFLDTSGYQLTRLLYEKWL